jgi:hypothetical protein
LLVAKQHMDEREKLMMLQSKIYDFFSLHFDAISSLILLFEFFKDFTDSSFGKIMWMTLRTPENEYNKTSEFKWAEKKATKFNFYFLDFFSVDIFWILISHIHRILFCYYEVKRMMTKKKTIQIGIFMFIFSSVFHSVATKQTHWILNE